MFILPKHLEKYKVTHFFFKPIALSQGEGLKLALSSSFSDPDFDYTVTNLITKEKVFEGNIEVEKTYNYYDQINVLIDGLPSYEKTIERQLDQPGIYSFNDQSLFIVKGNFNSDITIVNPLVTNHFYTPSDGVRIFESKVGSISLNRDVNVDEWTEGMLPLFLDFEKKYSVNYVTDLDLEDNTIFEKTKVIILYGKSIFWSTKMMSNINQFIENGGRVLVASSDVFYAKFCVNLERFKLFTAGCSDYKDSQNSMIQSWRDVHKSPKLMFNQFHSDFGGKSIVNDGLRVVNVSHPIFRGVELNGEIIPVEGSYYLGALTEQKFGTDVPLSKNIEILAYTKCQSKSKKYNVGGILEYTNQEGGKVLSLGTSDWCLEKNQNLKSTKLLFFNSLDYLLKDTKAY